MSKFAKKKDKLHYAISDIIEVLRDTYSMPIDCFDTHSIHKPSVGDLCVGFGGYNTLFEIKNSPRDKLSQGEADFSKRWIGIGQITVVWDFKQILERLKFTKGMTTSDHEYLDIMIVLYKDEILPNWKHYNIRFDKEWIEEFYKGE